MTQTPPPPELQPVPAPPPVTTVPRRSGGLPGWGIGLIIGGVLLVVLLVVALMVGVLAPTMGRARGLAMKAVCQSNLMMIGRGIQMYQADYNAMPPDMDTLIAQGGVMSQAFKCPCCQSGRKSDYFIHLPAKGDEEPDPQTVIACDWKGNHPDGARSVLTVDGMVTQMSKERFESQLKLPRNAEFAKALRKAEGG